MLLHICHDGREEIENQKHKQDRIELVIVSLHQLRKCTVRGSQVGLLRWTVSEARADKPRADFRLMGNYAS